MEEQKTMQQLQKEVDDYIGQFKEGYFTPMELTVRLTEELGELSREVMHEFGPKKKKSSEEENSVGAELGDLLFVMICLANRLDIDLQAEHDRVMEKFNTRDKNRWTRKEDTK